MQFLSVSYPLFNHMFMCSSQKEVFFILYLHIYFLNGFQNLTLFYALNVFKKQSTKRKQSTYNRKNVCNTLFLNKKASSL